MGSEVIDHLWLVIQMITLNYRPCFVKLICASRRVLSQINCPSLSLDSVNVGRSALLPGFIVGKVNICLHLAGGICIHRQDGHTDPEQHGVHRVLYRRLPVQTPRRAGRLHCDGRACE